MAEHEKIWLIPLPTHLSNDSSGLKRADQDTKSDNSAESGHNQYQPARRAQFVHI